MEARRFLSGWTLALALGVPMILAGCGGGEDTAAGQAARDAVGAPESSKTQTVESTHDLTVIEEKKVIDNTTGATISDSKKVTPVKVTKEKEVSTDVKVDVGDTEAVQSGRK